ncbi:hypothetical protein ACOMHN_045444 [Nucella lapillus]
MQALQAIDQGQSELARCGLAKLAASEVETKHSYGKGKEPNRTQHRHNQATTLNKEETELADKASTGLRETTGQRQKKWTQRQRKIRKWTQWQRKWTVAKKKMDRMTKKKMDRMTKKKMDTRTTEEVGKPNQQCVIFGGAEKLHKPAQTDTSAPCVRQPLLHTPPLLPLGLSLSVQDPLTTINMATI